VGVQVPSQGDRVKFRCRLVNYGREASSCRITQLGKHRVQIDALESFKVLTTLKPFCIRKDPASQSQESDMQQQMPYQQRNIRTTQ